MNRGFRVGRIRDIDIVVDWSLLIIFALISVSLALGVFPAWHPGWDGSLAWTVALAAAVLFFGSVLLHELAHAVVARSYGMDVPRITLFIFGGVSHLKSEAPHWRAELWMAAVGPLTSLVIGLVCVFLGRALAGPEPSGGDPLEFMSSVGPLATLLLWLGPVNLILALFNLVPGYPLDGGRVLRALIWGVSGDEYKATRWASAMGQAFAWLLIGAGVAMILGLQVPLFGGGVVGGLWLAFIGWFLNNAAIMGYRQLVVRDRLEHVPVRQLMLTDPVTVEGHISLEALINEHLMHSSQRAFPVLRDGRLAGLVTLHDLRRVAADERARTAVSMVMTPVERLQVVEPDTDASQAMALLTEAEVNQLPVVMQGRLVGLLTRENVLRWLTLKGRQT